MWGKGWQHPLSGRGEGQEIVAILELTPLFRRLGEGGGLRDVGSGTEGCSPRAVSPGAGPCPHTPRAQRRLSTGGDGSAPSHLSLCQPGNVQAEILLLLLPPAGAVCGRQRGGWGGSWERGKSSAAGLGQGGSLRPAREWGCRNGLEDTPGSGSCVGRGEQGMLPQGKWEQHPGLGCKWE